MKKCLLLALTTVLTSAAQAQELPAKQVKWEKEDANCEAELKQGEEELSVVLTAAGQLLETETEIQVAQLPAESLRRLLGNESG
ncbi:hypothetical protein EJV47_01355 [Hymenobacter gummosus]|uniref:Uncharacterized protein n=1 Tax=Hymenobacter gummosus TaxID=1776032 RepID=A0A3S0HCE9_9BACT|nr:hypothetical protein [Hymenobacter gummosus]RTQ53414.1 hypothetical protein EJV47_01355 [Hymenobacter gummosus]